MRTLLLALTMLLTASHASASADNKNDAEYLALRDTMYHAFNDGDSARFFPSLQRLQDYLLSKNDLHGYYTQRCNEIVFLMNRQRIFEAYKLAHNLSKELREKKLDKEMYMAINMMGHINRYCGNKEAAKECFEQVIQMMKEAGYYESMPPIYMNIVNVELGDNPEEAQRLLTEALEIAKKYSPERVFDIETRRTLSYFNGGDKKTFMEGYQQYRKGVEEGKHSVHGRLMDIYYQVCLGNTDKALEMVNSDLGEDGLDATTMIYEQAGRWHEAYESLKKQTEAQDSINNVVLTNSMLGISDELKIYEAERQIARNRTIALMIGILLLAVLVAAFAYIAITRRRHLKELRVAYDRVLEADQLKLAFIRNVTHEVRTPLNIIGGFAQVIADPELVAHPEERKDIAQTMLKNTRLITSLIDELLELSLNETTSATIVKDSEVKVNSLLRELLEDNESKVNPGVKMVLASTLADDFTLKTSEEMFKRIINSLLDNACKYTDQGTITLKASADDSLLTLIVEDTGKGIPADQAERIFERFVKLDTFKEGLGLGLSLSRMIAEKLDGSVILDTDYQHGARFVVKLRIEN
ncbi:MAG: HAMP domain-containing histidine kinase [Prevotella sp.]|nr:HAMP domain-containing histidine kinase [Prevotella sp.]